MTNMLARWAKLYKGTPAEHAIEPAVASLGVPYRFQHPLWNVRLFPDFCLPTLGVVIEVDDSGHFTKAGRAKDVERTAKLNQAGYRVVRCTNEQAVADPYGTVNQMMASLGFTLRAEPKDI
jgi:very-short-patch-repair endonuclease